MRIMSDLQERVAGVVLAHRRVDLLACACGWGPPRRSDVDLAAHQSGAVVVEVAAWLREQEGHVAEQLRDQFPNSTMADHWFGARSVLHRLTDEAEPAQTPGGGDVDA
jgi:hypothetical protein